MAVKAKEPSANGHYGAEATRLPVQQSGGLTIVSCTLQGVPPGLLLNAMPRDTLLGLLPGLKPAKTAEKPQAKDIAESHLHVLADGRPCVPLPMLWAAFAHAGRYVRLDGKRQISTADSTLLNMFLTFQSAELPLLKPGSKESATWDTDIQQGRNPNGGQAVGIVRPRFDAWEINAEFTLDRSKLAAEKARELVDLAGKISGLGDFRPNRRGMFGQFVVTKWELN